MHILITGGTGLIGRSLCAALTALGAQITVLSRRPQQVASLCGSRVQAMQSLDEWTPEIRFDAVINLAGEPIVDAYWTSRRKQVLRDSRIQLTQHLVEKIQQAKTKPEVLISGSAIGYYGIVPEQSLNEDAPCGQDFSAQLCVDWELAAKKAQESGVRVVLLRTGLVLDETGGMLKKLVLPFQLALGSRLGNGKQWMSWVHWQDYLRAVLFLLNNVKTEGAYNLTAPAPVTNAVFTKTLAETLGRPAFFVAPAFVLKLVMGERSDLLLGGQKVLPQRLQESGFVFEFPELPTALQEILKS
jgi:uncharacterized protein (TIGR01777 family)